MGVVAGYLVWSGRVADRAPGRCPGRAHGRPPDGLGRAASWSSAGRRAPARRAERRAVTHRGRPRRRPDRAPRPAGRRHPRRPARGARAGPALRGRPRRRGSTRAGRRVGRAGRHGRLRRPGRAGGRRGGRTTPSASSRRWPTPSPTPCSGRRPGQRGGGDGAQAPPAGPRRRRLGRGPGRPAADPRATAAGAVTPDRCGPSSASGRTWVTGWPTSPAVGAARGTGDVVAVSPVYETEPVGRPRGQGPYLNLVVELLTTDDSPRRAARALPARSRRPPAGSGRCASGPGPSTSTCCWWATSASTSPTSWCPTRGCGSGGSCWRRWPIWPPTWSTRRAWRAAGGAVVRRGYTAEFSDSVTIRSLTGDRHPTGLERRRRSR